MGNNVFICPVCGRKTSDYKHKINKVLIAALAKLNAVGGRATLQQLDLTNTRFSNFQKLRYFGLIYPTNKKGEWQITELGIQFLQGRKTIPDFVITRNANLVRKSEEQVFITDVEECVMYKIEWQEQASQPTLFDNNHDNNEEQK